MNCIEEWWSSGEQVVIRLGGTDRTVFFRHLGSGPPLTLLHGFPSSSFDWAKVTPALAAQHTLVLADFLGFGASEKPVEHTYSISEQADLLESLWEQEGVDSTALVAHDYGASVAQELLARRAEGALRVDLASVCLLNGGIYPDLHRTQRALHALLDPERGPLIAAGLEESALSRSLTPTFAADFDADEELATIWRSLTREDGQRIIHRLARYVPDRVEHAGRWTGALEQTDVPLAFIWGMLDPVSGAHIAERISERLPAAPLSALEDVGHWPALEVPQRVTAAVLGT